MHVDNKISAPKLITHEQIFPKIFWLRMINYLWYYSNPTFSQHLLKGRLLLNLLYGFLLILCEGEYKLNQIFGNTWSIEPYLFTKTFGLACWNQSENKCYFIGLWFAIKHGYTFVFFWISWCFIELSFIRILLKWEI